MASLSRKARLQQCCWELLDDLAFCRERYSRLAELAAHGAVLGAGGPAAGGG